jgi:hypothetical protein
MRSPTNTQHGIVAILDALGAATYSDLEIQSFLKSRENALKLLDEKIEGVLGPSQGSIFTFNDTLLIAFKTDSRQPELREVEGFFTVLRKFFVDSLAQRILFRGAVAIGTFYADNDSNTVMGQAVTDAAAWYDKADWIGILATPRTTIAVQALLEKDNKKKAHLMLDYDVPLKDGKSVRVKAVNWPKVFFVDKLTPCSDSEKPREKFLGFLSQHSVPFGTEQKFSQTIAFFDHSVRMKNEADKRRRKLEAANFASHPGGVSLKRV